MSSKTSACRILEAETGGFVRSFPLPIGGGASIAWSPDGTTLATACDDAKIYLWDAMTGTRKATLEGSYGPRNQHRHPPRRHAAGQRRLGRSAAALGPGPGPALAERDRRIPFARIQPGWTNRSSL